MALDGSPVCPRNFANVEELVVASRDDAILDVGPLDVVSVFCSEQSTSQSRKWTGNIIILELVHLPAGDFDAIICRGNILARLDELGILPGKRVERVDEL